VASAWGDSWNAAWGVSWGAQEAQTPRRAPFADVEETDDYIRIGRLIRYKRPRSLEPVVAEKKVVRRVAKRLKIRAEKAVQHVETARRDMASTLGFIRHEKVAYSPSKTGWDANDIAIMRAWWRELENRAVELVKAQKALTKQREQDEEEEEELLLLM
jgi:hypothetical protein